MISVVYVTKAVDGKRRLQRQTSLERQTRKTAEVLAGNEYSNLESNKD